MPGNLIFCKKSGENILDLTPNGNINQLMSVFKSITGDTVYFYILVSTKSPLPKPI